MTTTAIPRAAHGPGRTRTPEELKALDAVSALPPEYPGWMLSRQGDARRAQIAAGAPAC